MYQTTFFRTFFLLLLLQVSGYVEASSVDSLKNELSAEQDSSKRFEILIQITKALENNQPVEAMPYARDARDLARSLGNPVQEVNALGYIANIYFNVKAFAKTLEVARKMEQVAQAGDNLQGLGRAYNRIGTVYYMQGDTGKALDYYEKALNTLKRSNVKHAHLGILNNISALQIDAGSLDVAEANLFEARTANQEIGDITSEAFNLLHLGILESKRRNRAKSLAYFEEGLALADSSNFSELKSSFLLKMSELEIETEHFWEAKQILQQLVIGDSTTVSQDLALAHAKLASIHKLAGSYRKAYGHLEIANHIQDSLEKEGLEGRIQSIELANELNAADRAAEIEVLKQAQIQENELERSKLGNYITLLMLLVVAALAIGLLIAYAIKRRSNRKLASLVDKRTKALVDTNEELNTFMYRSSHEIRGAINSIQGLYDLAANYSGDQDEVMKLLGTKVMQLEHGQRNLIYTMELRSAVATPVEIEIRKAVREAVARIKERRFEAEIDFRMEIPTNIRSTTGAWMLSIILENLLDNSVVFRNESQASWCRITSKQLPEGTEIRIEDNGIGMEKEVQERAFEMFFRGSLKSAGSGLGLYNVHLATSKLGGTVTFAPKPGKGTLVVVKLPKQIPS